MLRLLSAIAIILLAQQPARAQNLIPDSTLGDEGSKVIGDRIEGGAIRDSNLFHSFREFGVSEGRAIYFANPDGIENIFSRVTGSNPSAIDGTLGVLGNANLFLLNPNGIIFGPEARLDLRGSFFAGAVEGYQFDGGIFSATVPGPPLLTLRVPVGIQGASLGEIASLGASLEVPPTQALALSGERIVLEDSNLIASTVELDATGDILLLSSNILIENRGDAPGGLFRVLTETLKLDSLSRISSRTFSTGTAGDIAIQARELTLSGESRIDASTQAFNPDTLSNSTGEGGAISIEAETIEISELSSIATSSFSLGSGGDMEITADSLTLTTGGRIRSDALLAGDGGQIAIRANEITIAGSAVELSGDRIASGVEAGSATFLGAGSGGSVDIESDRLTLTNSGTISVASEGEGAAGNISIAADVLRVERGGTMNASTRSPGAAQGNIELAIGDILLIRGGAIATDSPELAGSGNVGLRMSPGGLALGVENIEPSGGVLTIAGQTGGLDFAELEIDFIDEDELIADSCLRRRGGQGVSSFTVTKPNDTNTPVYHINEFGASERDEVSPEASAIIYAESQVALFDDEGNLIQGTGCFSSLPRMRPIQTEEARFPLFAAELFSTLQEAEFAETSSGKIPQ